MPEIKSRLTVNSKKLEAALDRIQKGLDKTAKKANRVGNRVQASFKKMGKAGLNAAKVIAKIGAAAALAAIGGISLLVKKNLDLIDNIAKMSAKLGISTEALTGLGFAANLAGADFAELQKAMTKLQKNSADAAEGLSTPARAFNKLNIDVNKFIQLKPEDQLLVMADALKGVSNQSERVQIAMDTMGRAAVDLIPLLIQGGDAIKFQMEQAKALGFTFDDLAASRVEAANDAFTELGAIFSGVGKKITIALAPFLEGLASFLRDNLPQAIDVVIGWFGNLGKWIGKVGGWLLDLQEKLAEFVLDVIKITNKLPTWLGGADQGDTNALTKWAQGRVDAIKLVRAALAELNANIDAARAKPGSTLITNRGFTPGTPVGVPDVPSGRQIGVAGQNRIGLSTGKTQAQRDAEAIAKRIAGINLEQDTLNKLIGARRKSETAFENELKLQEAINAARASSAKEGSKEFENIKNLTLGTIGLNEQLEKLGEIAAQQVDPFMEAVKEMRVGIEDLTDMWVNRFSDMEDAIVGFAKTGKFDFKSMLASMTEDLIRFYFRAGIFGNNRTGGGGLLGAIGSIFSAKGNAFSGGITPFKKGGIATQPFAFPIKNGIGIGAEAGAEAIMPLQRDGRGRLGVSAVGAGASGMTNIITIEGAKIDMGGMTALQVGEALAIYVKENAVRAIGEAA